MRRFLVILMLSVMSLGFKTRVSLAESTPQWRFLNLADWHTAEKYVWRAKTPDKVAEGMAQDQKKVERLKRTFGGELIIMPGDTNGGHWDTAQFISSFAPEAKPEQVILAAGHACYATMRDVFTRGGYPKIFLAVGDHELGDNPWPAGSVVARCLPQFRQSFADVWNMDPDTKRFAYPDHIGQAPARPIGTPFENTSFAVQHKNVLFVTVDVFDQNSPIEVIGAQGTVTGAVTGEHLKWLDKVLGEARRLPSIKHVIVQAHLPVIYPVRMCNSSGLMMDGRERSDFWETLRRHHVDIYFAGEVHANTVTKDPQSDLLQIVSRGNFFSNVLVTDVTDDRLTLTLYDEELEDADDASAYAPIGKLVIDKRGPNKTITGDGRLALLDRQAAMLHFPFEEQLNQSDVRIFGLKQAEVHGKTCDKAFMNHGAFGEQYSATAAACTLIDGKVGRAVRLDTSSRLQLYGMGPLMGGHTVSYSCWVRTTAEGERIVISTATRWRSLKHLLNLHLSDGRPKVVTSVNTALLADGVTVNDGQWHHLAVVRPAGRGLLTDVELYADGQRLKTKLLGKDHPVGVNHSCVIGLGGTGYSAVKAAELNAQPYVGDLDEFELWVRQLPVAEMQWSVLNAMFLGAAWPCNSIMPLKRPLAGEVVDRSRERA